MFGAILLTNIKVSIPSRGLLEGIETLTSLWYHNNKWPRKEPGRTFNLSIHESSNPNGVTKRSTGSLAPNSQSLEFPVDCVSRASSSPS